MQNKKQNTKSNKKNAKSPNKVLNTLRAIVRFFRDERFKVSLGLFFLVFSIILCVSFVSYLFTWKADQSILNMSLVELFTNGGPQVENGVGKLGAVLSNKFIYDWFGLASFSFVAVFAVFGLGLLKIKLINSWRFFYLSLIFTVWGSIALSSIFAKDFFMAGGAYGFFIFEWLVSILGKAGAYAVLPLSLFVIIIYCFKGTLDWLKSEFKKLISLKKENFEEEVDDNIDHIVADETQTESEIQYKETPEIQINTSENQQENLENQELVGEQNIVNLFEDDSFTKDKKTDTELEITPIVKEEEAISTELSIDTPVRPTEPANDGELSLEVQQAEPDEELSVEEIESDIMKEYDPTKDLEHYKFPSIDILEEYQKNSVDVTPEELNSNKDRIVNTLRDYKIEISKISATIGPTVTLYEIVPAPGVRIAKIKNLEDDIALSLAALGIRIIAPIPGKGTIGIEVPNLNPETVSMRSVIKSAKFQESTYELPVAMGKTISNETYVFNLAKTPHLLVAGATGQGKSVGVNAILTSLLYKKHPSQLKFVLVDPKMVELSIYSRIEKHYLAKLPKEKSCIVTDVSKVVPVMNSLCIEMDRRYELLTKASVRNIIEYNTKFVNRKLNPNNGHFYMPYIVVIIDEFADIIVQEGKQVEAPISRLAAKARAIGIHLIVATQRPSTDVITGVIKANFPTRIAFKVTNGHDSKTILDSTGANQLIGRGDLLISETGKVTRVQCAFVDTPEVEKLVDHISEQQGYPAPLELPEPEIAESVAGGEGFGASERDDLFEEAARIIVRHQQGSTSLVQRKMAIGYNRAGRIIDQLEAAGIIGPYEGSKARQVLISDEYALEQFLRNLDEKK